MPSTTPKTALLISRSLSETEIKEYQEGISYGALQVRDGVNLSLQSKKAPLISPTQIQSLPNNHAYLKLPGNTPITKLSPTLKWGDDGRPYQRNYELFHLYITYIFLLSSQWL
ncbi:MAG: Coupling protein TraD [Chlamydiae bacterium]|nr:Coupling protein TraD [Chlamydiota bacterium]